MLFIVSSYHNNVSMKEFFEKAVSLGLVLQYAYCFHDKNVNAYCPHWHIYVMPKDESAKEFIESIFGAAEYEEEKVSLKDIVKYMKHFSKNGKAKIFANFDVEAVLKS